MRIYITGIAGFIGFHLAMHLKNRGDYVVGCDNFNAYYSPSLKYQRASLLQDNQIEVITGDINDSALLKKTLEEHSIAHFVHLAAQAGCRNCHEQLDAYMHSNLNGFLHILEVCKHYPAMPLIFASSSSVYGLNEKTPFSEEDLTDKPASLYAATKKANELLAFTYHHLYQMRITALRFFTVYGPWGRPDMAYFSFAHNILHDLPITLFHNGEMQRDFTYIDDIVKGTLAAIDLSAPWEIFNLGNNRPHSINTLISLIEKATKKKAHIEHKPKQAEEVLVTFADISKAQKHLGFTPSTTLEEGMHHFLSWLHTHPL